MILAGAVLLLSRHERMKHRRRNQLSCGLRRRRRVVRRSDGGLLLVGRKSDLVDPVGGNAPLVMKQVVHDLLDGLLALLLLSGLVSPLFLGRLERLEPLLLPVNHGGNFGLGQLDHRIGSLGQSPDRPHGAAVLPDLGQVAEVHDVRAAGEVKANVQRLKKTGKTSFQFAPIVKISIFVALFFEGGCFVTTC